MPKLESGFALDLKKDLEKMFPGIMILKQDPNMRQGIPDLLLLWKNKWAALETKRAVGAAKQVNQEYYVEKLGKMSYAAFINPTNRQEVLDGLQKAFGVRR